MSPFVAIIVLTWNNVPFRAKIASGAAILAGREDLKKLARWPRVLKRKFTDSLTPHFIVGGL